MRFEYEGADLNPFDFNEKNLLWLPRIQTHPDFVRQGRGGVRYEGIITYPKSVSKPFTLYVYIEGTIWLL